MQRAIADAGRRAALGFGAAVMMAVGMAFLTAAGFIALAAWRDPLFAALIVGLVYLGLAAILMGFASRKPSAPPPPSPEELAASAAQRDAAFRAAMAEAGLEMPRKGEFPPLVQAFMFGLTMAQKLRR